jgi:hypothetical protein
MGEVGYIISANLVNISSNDTEKHQQPGFSMNIFIKKSAGVSLPDAHH